MERVLTFHTQEVRGSSPCAPTISESSWPRVFLFQSIKMRTSITTGVVRFVGSLALPAQIGDFCFGLGNLLLYSGRSRTCRSHVSHPCSTGLLGGSLSRPRTKRGRIQG
jgi:hypothetical protein